MYTTTCINELLNTGISFSEFVNALLMTLFLTINTQLVISSVKVVMVWQTVRELDNISAS